MKLFVASHSRELAKDLKATLMEAGHEVTARWIDEDTKFHRGLSAYTDEERTQLAIMDEEDVRNATDGLVLISEEEGRTVPGGKHVEAGIALALNRSVYVVGRRENIFHWHPRVTVLADVDALLSRIGPASV
ncbi:MAG: hypothetical protein GC159_16240 [Phycisphaera sp.]|nr:hypothetical protein [Phycisphaera sp.]